MPLEGTPVSWPPNLDKESKLLVMEGQTELENNFSTTDSSVGKETIFPALSKTAMSNTGTWDVQAPSAGAMSLLDVQYVEATEREKLKLDGKESKKIFVPPSALLAAVTRKGNEIKNLLRPRYTRGFLTRVSRFFGQSSLSSQFW